MDTGQASPDLTASGMPAASGEMGDQGEFARQQSFPGDYVANGGAYPDGPQGTGKPAPRDAHTNALDLDTAVNGRANHSRREVTEKTGALEAVQVAGTLEVSMRALTLESPPEEAAALARPVAEPSAATDEQQPLCDVGLDASVLEAEIRTSDKGGTGQPEELRASSYSPDASPTTAPRKLHADVSGMNNVPSHMTPEGGADTRASARAAVAHVAAMILSQVSERAVQSLTNASGSYAAGKLKRSVETMANAAVEHEGEISLAASVPAAVNQEVEKSLGASTPALGVRDMLAIEKQKGTDLHASSAAQSSEAILWDRDAALVPGGEDETEKEFEALSPVRRYLGSHQQQMDRKTHGLTEDHEGEDAYQQQQQSINASLLPSFQGNANVEVEQQAFHQFSLPLSRELRHGNVANEAASAERPSAGKISDLQTSLQDDLLPAFANEENKRLHAEIQSMRKGLTHINARIAEREERTQMLSEHLKHVLMELQQTSKLAAAKMESMRTEEHMAALQQRHASQLQRHSKDITARIDTYAEQLLSLNSEMVAGSARLDQFKLQMNWNAAELKQWSVAENQKQQDRLQVERLQRADEREVKKLTLSVEKLCAETQKIKEKLYMQNAHARGLHVELESAAVQFNGIQQERLRLIEQWESALESMQQRDEAIQHAAARYSMAQEEIKQKLAHLESMQKFTREQTAANEELQKHLQQLEKAAAKLRELLAAAKSRLNVVNASGEELRSQLSAATTAVAKTRKEIEHLQEQLELRRQQLANLKSRYVHSQKRIEKELQKAGSEDEALKKVEAFHAQLEEDCKAMDKKLKRSRQLLLEELQLHTTQQAENQATQAELNSSKAALRNLLTKLQRLDQDRQRQQELLYAVEFQSQVMQRKVARAAGYRGTAEKKQLVAKIEKLTQLLEQQKQQVQMLTSQLRRLESELRKAQREQQIRQRGASHLTEVLGDLRLECDSLRRDAADKQKEKESLYVEHDTLQLEVKRLHDQLRATNAAACAAEADKQQLQAQIEEQILEAESRLELIRTAAKVAYEERHKLAMELATRKSKILNLETKYSVLVQKIKTDGGDDVERSQAYYIIKASQEKQDLQRVGDELDQKIRDAEQESRSLEVTLQQLRQRNRNYKQSLESERHSVQNERENRKDFEAQLILLHDKIYEQQQLARRMKAETQAEEQRVNETHQHLKILSENLESVRDTLRSSKKELTEQMEKLKRAEKQHRKLLLAARAKKLVPEHGQQDDTGGLCEEEAAECPFFYDPTRQNNIEMEPHLEGLKAHMRALLHSLTMVLSDGRASFSATAPAVLEALAAHGLKLQSRPASVLSSSDSQTLRGGSNGSNGSEYRPQNSSLSSSSRGSSASLYVSVAQRQDGISMGVDGDLSSSPSHSVRKMSSWSSSLSENRYAASSTQGHVLTGRRIQTQKSRGGRAATVELPVSNFVKGTGCKTQSVGGSMTVVKAASGPPRLLPEEVSDTSQRAGSASGGLRPG